MRNEDIIEKMLRVLEQYQDQIAYDDCGWVDLSKTLKNALHRAKTYGDIVDNIEEIIVANPAVIMNTEEDEHVIDVVKSVKYAIDTCNGLCRELERKDCEIEMLRDELAEYEIGG